ncbi:hypothetical protein TRVL_09522 [Trypanosoma vivax]|uniref:Uncharacterized protein n=1 Tax=Trypanosoma vivax (strain Y486) TaxID=1055687 RepID=F9WTD7_TRYVY|nr:hypothetical protein TRVL_09522 [Trypanosoma vivax]CCC52253.1 conserved hypothetical protein [Trypanosoma vivax Y486]CCD20830.1 hypothetical protein, conserved [Trypanosoma vivax Y486]|eukprot:CCD20830.1 hypothetical protein, conserved [Trypanosoma vivax Y486]
MKGIDERRRFLAHVQHELILHSCRALAYITVCTGRSFMDVARRGCPPSESPIASEVPGNVDEQQFEEYSAHEVVYRTVRSTIASSCALGHRSCHMLWGPRGCGEHRLLRLIARDFSSRKDTLVLYLDGDTLNGDEDALRCIAHQMFLFLQSPQSERLRANDWSLRSGTFDFGRLFGFDKLFEGEGDKAGASLKTLKATRGCRKGGGHAGTGGTVSGGKRGRHSSQVAWDVDSECSSDTDNEQLIVTSTTAYLAGGASSALSALQRALLMMKSYGTNLVVCIRRIERFGVWCDQLLYVLSGLMHEGDGRGGGISLLMTSSTPDVRQLEKRLSSRLTCVTCYVPLLSWSVICIARACLVEVKERLECEINDAQPKDTSPGQASKKYRQAVTSPSERCLMATLSGSYCSGAPTSSPTAADSNSESRQSSYSIRLVLLTMLRMVNVVIEELDAVSCAQRLTGDEEDLSQRIFRTSVCLRSAGATTGKLIAAVSSAFAEVGSGRLALVRRECRTKLLSWLTKELPKMKDEINDGRAVFATAPEAVLAIWMNAGCESKYPAAVSTSNQKCSHFLNDMLSECRLVKLGYCTREMFLILVYVFLRHQTGVTRTVVDLLEDIASSMGTQAAAALDVPAFRAAVVSLHRWRVLRVGGRDGTTAVTLRRNPARLKEFLREVLHEPDLCTETLGLQAKEVARLRSLV